MNVAPPPGWLADPAIQALLDALGEARFVGGAVRDALLGRPAGDLDLATPLPPETVIARLKAAGIGALPTGLAHGTVTAPTAAGPIEITTLRRDLETDGRHAIIGFTDDWAVDAARRDFTMNALYMDRRGAITDPLGGLDDCLSGRVRFIGDPRQRIIEDGLRILRFYRFQAHYGRQPADGTARRGCADLASRLGDLSAERVRAELFKLLTAPDPVPSLRLMDEDGVLRHILPGPARLDILSALIPLEDRPDPLRRLAALGPAPGLARRLRLSSAESDRLDALTHTARPALDGDERARRRDVYRLGPALYRDLALLAAAEQNRPDAAAGDIPAPPRLPVGGADLLALGLTPGPALGAALRRIEAWWIEGDFQADRAACLDFIMESRPSGLGR